METTLSQVSSQVDKLVNVVETLLTGVKNAQENGGMMGMMARNMLPDVTALPFEFPTNVG
jgi:hypothetical protein